MSIHATVNFNNTSHTYNGSDEAKEAVRLTFNPSALESVTRLKLLSTLFIAECDRVLSDQKMGGIETRDGSRELAVAKTNMQTASMWAVLGATKGL